LLGRKIVCCFGIRDKKKKKLLSAIVHDFEKSNLSIDEGVLAVSFAILRSNKLIDDNWRPNTNSKLDALLSDWTAKIPGSETAKNYFSKYEIPNLDDDILGAFYQSVQSISRKSGSGSYYTPSALLAEIKIPPDRTVLDPCCGSGGILLGILSKSHKPSKIFARDIDETALKICFINLALFFGSGNIRPNISKRDIVFDFTADRVCRDELSFYPNDEQFDYIVTNPPWGSKFTIQQKKSLGKLYPELGTTETFSISLYNAAKMLKKNGELYFFLPHSFLNVAAHRKIRQYVFNENYKVSVKLLGNAFKGVLSESILLHLKSGSAEKHISIQNKEGNFYQIPLQNSSSPGYFVSAASKTQDTLLIDKIYNTGHTTLAAGGVTFALGIVTGDNKKYLTEEKLVRSEAVFRGKDIDKYIFQKPKYYLEFNPDLFQQTAPREYYRQEKIAYRFISGHLVCALDRENRLLLNSANLLISGQYPMETIVSLFNSDIYTFIFKKKYHSRKVLKSHLLNLPLPILPGETHKRISKMYNETFIKNCGAVSLYQQEIDKIICSAFSINERQYNYIKGELRMASLA
jgi:tRNA1(Val) A37 N6-methylase TrmN6